MVTNKAKCPLYICYNSQNSTEHTTGTLIQNYKDDVFVAVVVLVVFLIIVNQPEKVVGFVVVVNKFAGEEYC